MIVQKEGETRIQYLMRVLEQYMHGWNRAIDYDDATCDGRCLAGDIKDELDALGLLEEIK